jgi:hypothetical protein
MKNLNFKAILFAISSIILIILALNLLKIEVKPKLNIPIIKTEIVDSAEIYFYMNKQFEADEIINDNEFKASMNKSELTELLIYIDSLCIEYDVEYRYVKAIIANESRWNQYAEGSGLDYGLMQITPIASKAVKLNHGPELFNCKYNVLSGIRLLAILQKSLTSIDEVLVAYNAGIGNVMRHDANYVTNHKYIKNINIWLNHQKYF